jgi:hypothetical protein
MQETEYKRLPEVFTFRKNSFKQLRRDGDVAMYERVCEDGCRYWEVIRIKRSKGGENVIGGVRVVFEAKEVYPADEQFGVNGWCYGGEGMALERYRMLTEPVKNVDSVKTNIEAQESNVGVGWGVGITGGEISEISLP